jgi:Ca2+-binding EF-hand superfamily protein
MQKNNGSNAKNGGGQPTFEENKLATSFVKRIFDTIKSQNLTFKGLLKIMYPTANDQSLERLMDVADPKRNSSNVDEIPTKEEEDEVTEIFNLWDMDGNGDLDIVEFRSILRKMGIDDQEEIDEYFHEIDEDDGGSISVDEFRDWWFKVSAKPKASQSNNNSYQRRY